jgi:predicted nuclease with TOPRIM domain
VSNVRNLVFGTLALCLFALPTGPASAQEATVGAAEGIEAAVKDRARESRSDRSALHEFLQRSDVEEVASNNGIELEDLESRLETLDDAEVSELWREIQGLTDSLAGGDSITIATSTLIVILLIIILIQVA